MMLIIIYLADQGFNAGEVLLQADDVDSEAQAEDNDHREPESQSRALTLE